MAAWCRWLTRFPHKEETEKACGGSNPSVATNFEMGSRGMEDSLAAKPEGRQQRVEVQVDACVKLG